MNIPGEKSARPSSKKPIPGSQTPSYIKSKSPKKGGADSLNSSIRSGANTNRLSSYRNVHVSENEKLKQTGSPINFNNSQNNSNNNTNLTRSYGLDQTTVEY